MGKRYLPPGVDPPPKAERLGSPALSAQRRLISETGRAESASEGRKTKKKRFDLTLAKERGKAYNRTKVKVRKRVAGK